MKNSHDFKVGDVVKIKDNVIKKFPNYNKITFLITGFFEDYLAITECGKHIHVNNIKKVPPLALTNAYEIISMVKDHFGNVLVTDESDDSDAEILAKCNSFIEYYENSY